MALLTYILLLHFLNYTLTKNCVIDNTPEYVTWEKELLKDLKCGYSAHHAPSDSTIVNVTYFIEAFKFDNKEEVMTLQLWLSAMWKDERLKWDPEKHHGINETDVSHFNLWSPIFGPASFDDSPKKLDFVLSFYHYDLKSSGDVHMQYLSVQEAWCSIKLTDWPYDVQECSFDFAALEYPGQIGNYTIDFDFIIMQHKSAEWYLYDYKHVEDNSTTRQTKLTFFMMREAVGLSAIVIYPAFILTVLSMLSLCLDVRRKVRLAIICFSLLGHYYFLTELSYHIPKECHFPPTLLLYYRGSVVLSAIIILLTFFLAAMCKLKSTPHNYVRLINDFVYKNKYKTYLMFPRWNFDDATVDIKASSEDWVKFANIVNSVFIICVVLAYIGLYGTKIAKRTHYDVNNDYILLRYFLTYFTRLLALSLN